MNTHCTLLQKSVPSLSYHVGDERGSEFPGQEVIPVDGCEKGMFL